MPSVFEVESVREASEVIGRAAADGLPVSIEREGGEVVVSTARLDQVLEHEAGDLTVAVEAGVRVEDLNMRLAEHGQMLALDPPGNPTIGACIAGDLSGPRRHRYGTARDLVLGVTVVLGDGTVASSGGKVVKNVAGYDLGKLFCGSRGRLGLVARASLRLHPRPDAVRTLAVPVDSAEAAGQVARSLLESQLVPSALDVMWPGSLVTLFEGGRRSVDVQFAAAQELVGGTEDFGDIWEEIGARQRWAQGRLAFEPAGLAETLARLPEAVVRVAAGVAYVGEPVLEAPEPGLVRLVERIRAEFDPRGVLC